MYPGHDDQKGYGILNFGNVLSKLLLTNKVSVSNDLKIYPNPVKDNLNFQTTEKIISEGLYDSLGRFIRNLGSLPSNNVNNLSSGVYFLKVTTDKKTHVQKFIKK
ncbi:T9SS type A sorting domain-containing protein [Halpernia sp. GG3]